VNLNQMKDLHLFLENASGASDSGKLPTAQQTIDILKSHQDGRILSQLITDGDIVLVGNPSRESIWAYTKNAPSQGGIAISSSGTERVTAAELQQRLK